jgi:hypothetical protein
MSENKYFSEQEWENADGGWSGADSSYFADDENAEGDLYADEAANAEYFADMNAGGKHKKPHADVSLPYIVTVQNTTASTITSVSMFNAYVNLYSGGTASAAGWTINNVNYVNGNPVQGANLGQAYVALLSQSMTKVFVCGQIYLVATNMSTGVGQPSQAMESLFVYHSDANGESHTTPLHPKVDPNWNSPGVIVYHCDFHVDGYTNVVLGNLYAGCQVTFNFYPSKKVDSGKALRFNTIQQGYAPPRNIQGQTTVVVRK